MRLVLYRSAVLADYYHSSSPTLSGAANTVESLFKIFPTNWMVYLYLNLQNMIVALFFTILAISYVRKTGRKKWLPLLINIILLIILTAPQFLASFAISMF